MDCSRCITLENARVRLRPLEASDFDDLKAVIFDPEIWRFTTTPNPGDAVGLAAYLTQAAHDRAQHRRYPFAIIDRTSGRVVGSTSYGSFALEDKRLEIGWTWLGRDFQRTGLNRAVKHLLLKYAFGELGCERVELKTDALNWQSREAMRRMGATEEGTLRSHMPTQGGRRRDSVYFSILKPEWDVLRKTVFQEFDARG
ncbi:Protein N-acetyltransferase, RimJ/RimL family [Hymenobacter daecheongensis DSM 21074]|uniref:Protein N-acetyltransferase, RimJ/RimL family n=1 Tax=Hymenobacter daecheongensis DSM 21074 TaxID=1121955 RepID=A0A1M6AXJ2_9BACT|nr:GNAT family protein [Hymenobacter daecheongensis]SHI41269.1 Protein N-acetyltransferase, RimJ/RimL family [Hymenobacter daecheongensis DSM 21074]